MHDLITTVSYFNLHSLENLIQFCVVTVERDKIVYAVYNLMTLFVDFRSKLR